jgi:tRNA(His) 5'-end guanylyltransferase
MMHDSLGDRMKGYEQASRTNLPRRMPVIIRVDGKAFHTWTRELKRPFDSNLEVAMNLTAFYLCKEIEGAVLAYVQSDEISVLVHNYKRLSSQPWFDNQVQKMCSVAAACASSAMTCASDCVFGEIRRAMFDARVFVLPEAEVCNYFLWRQKDAVRNSVQMLARSLYSHAECENKNNSQLQEMCSQKGQNWNDLPTQLRRGRCIVKNTGLPHNDWEIDNKIPLFNEDRTYIERLLATEDEQ